MMKNKRFKVKCILETMNDIFPEDEEFVVGNVEEFNPETIMYSIEGYHGWFNSIYFKRI